MTNCSLLLLSAGQNIQFVEYGFYYGEGKGQTNLELKLNLPQINDYHYLSTFSHFS